MKYNISTLSLCCLLFLAGVAAHANYDFETIAVEGVDVLAVTASSDFEDYAGYTKLVGSEKEVAFTLIEGVFATYDIPGSQKTHFYALGNNGNAAGHYLDADGLYHGVVLENGELREYDFPGSVQTEIYGISDATGALTGNFIDASGMRRGFTGDIVVEVPSSAHTFADFISGPGILVGSYIDADGIFNAYGRFPDGRFATLTLPESENLEYFYMHGITDVEGLVVIRIKRKDEVPRTLVGSILALVNAANPSLVTIDDQTVFQYDLDWHKLLEILPEMQYPDSFSTEGWNINQDGSVVGHYQSADGRIHGFIAKPAPAADTAAGETVATDGRDRPTTPPVDANYTFETIDVPGVEFLALTASSDFEDYAGYTKSLDGEKEIAFTLIDGIFTTYDFPGSQKTHFYALGNDGRAAGHYEDSEGLFHGVILKDGELHRYDFPGAVQTEIFGISDATGVLTGNFIAADGIRRGFTGDMIITFPGASETYADFVNAAGAVVGSYRDVDGTYHPYVRNPNGTFTTVKIPNAEYLEYFFLHGINDAWAYIVRNKPLNLPPRTYVGKLLQGVEAFEFSSDHELSLEQAILTLRELRFPDSVSTEGWNINQDGSVVGHYQSADGQIHGFIAKPILVEAKEDVNDDGVVDVFDLISIASKFGTHVDKEDPADVNDDGVINIQDLVLVANAIG